MMPTYSIPLSSVCALAPYLTGEPDLIDEEVEWRFVRRMLQHPGIEAVRVAQLGVLPTGARSAKGTPELSYAIQASLLSDY